MRLKNLLTDDDAVSPVIGVILMVAITVILAAVIGTFVLGLGQNVQSTAPQASFSFDQASGPEVTVSHDGGDTISHDNIDIVVDDDAIGNTGKWDGTDKEVSAGTSVTLSMDDLSTGDTIRVIWTSDSGENSQVLSKYTVA